LILAVCLAARLIATPAFAATWTWTGGSGPGGNNSWNNSGNWSPFSPPANNGTADIIFGSTPRLTPDLTLPWNVNSVTFNNATGVYNLFSTAGNTLTVGAGGMTNNSPLRQSIVHAITLSAAQTWTASAPDATVLVEGPVNNGGYLLTINNAAAGIYGVLSGSGGLTISGVAVVELGGSASNTYAGTTTVNGGALRLVKEGVADTVAIPGTLNIGDGVGAGIDAVESLSIDQIADSATVSVFSTGVLSIKDIFTPMIFETITNLNIESAGVAGGGLVEIDDGILAVLGTLTMAGGAVTTTKTGTLLLAGNLVANSANFSATISTKLDLGSGASTTITVADGATPNDLDVTGVVSNGGIIKAGPGVLRLGAANTYVGGTTVNGGTLSIGNNAALGTGPVIGNGGTLRADGATRTIANEVSGAIGVDGAFDLKLSSPLHGAVTKNGPGTLVFGNAGATASSLSVNGGVVRVDAPLTVTAGLTNFATVLLGTQTLTVNGAGFNNQGSLPLTGGTLAGSGPVVNTGLVSGNGVIDGTGGFTNNAQLAVSGGNLTLANAGLNANAGNVDIGPGLQVRLTGGMLANAGAVLLDGGVVTGTATLSNNVGGLISGRGMISAPLANAGGTLRAVGGTLNVASAFTSSGIIRLDDAAYLVGGSITNAGLIHGDGTIANALTNAGGGSIRVDFGKTLLITGAFAANVGEINLQGGALDFTGAITNGAAGVIAGRGALYTGGLTNSGQMAFSGGAADIHGDVTITAGARVVTSGAGTVTTFFDDVVHNGLTIFTGAGASTVFFGDQSGAGSFTGTGTVYYIGDLRPGNSAAAVSYGGALALGSTTTLAVELGGAAAGQYDQIQVAGALSLSGDLAVSLINGFAPTAGQSFNILDWGSLSGAFASLSLPALGGGVTWNVTQLYATGVISVAPAFTADFDGDGDVDANDLSQWQGDFGVNALSDADNDGDSDGADFLAWQQYFGSGQSPNSHLAPVPEPTTLVLLMFAAIGWYFQRSRSVL
jgi:autotransporter-associated beta strand protein